MACQQGFEAQPTGDARSCHARLAYSLLRTLLGKSELLCAIIKSSVFVAIPPSSLSTSCCARRIFCCLCQTLLVSLDWLWLSASHSGRMVCSGLCLRQRLVLTLAIRVLESVRRIRRHHGAVPQLRQLVGALHHTLVCLTLAHPKALLRILLGRGSLCASLQGPLAAVAELC